MIALADRLGADALVTGHYARVVDDGEGPLLAPAADSAKDQTYMLTGLAPASLARMRFPLAELSKPEVRALAGEAGLEVAGRAESQDLCFLAGQGKREFLRRHAGLTERPGEVVDRSGACSARTRAITSSRSASARGWGSPRPSRSTCSPPTPAPTPSRSGPRPARRRHRAPARRPPAPRRRPRRLGAAPLPLPAARMPGGIPGRGRLGDAVLDEPADAPAPGQVACLMSGGLVVGHGTIA
jgi:tRNA-specific 2-thiouridylase